MSTKKTVLASVLGTFTVLATIGALLDPTTSGTRTAEADRSATNAPAATFVEYPCESTVCREYSDGRVQMQIPMTGQSDIDLAWLAAGGTPGRWYSKDRYEEIGDRMVAHAARRLQQSRDDLMKAILSPTPDPYDR